MEEEKKKTTFFVCIFEISPCVFTQISLGRTRWMQNLILHPTSTHWAYFWRNPLPPKTRNTWKNVMMKYLRKRDDHIIITFFQVFLVFQVARSAKSMPSGYSLDVEFNSTSNKYPHCILLTDPTTPKTKNPWNNMMMMMLSSRFFNNFLCLG